MYLSFVHVHNNMVIIKKKKPNEASESESEEWIGESGKRVEDGAVLEMEWILCVGGIEYYVVCCVV